MQQEMQLKFIKKGAEKEQTIHKPESKGESMRKDK